MKWKVKWKVKWIIEVSRINATNFSALLGHKSFVYGIICYMLYGVFLICVIWELFYI